MRGVPIFTTTSADALPALPLASTNVNVTLVVPTGNNVVEVTGVAPTVGGCGLGEGSTASDAFAEPDAMNAASAAHAEGRAPPASVAGTMMLDGGVTTGAIVSRTITTVAAVPAAP